MATRFDATQPGELPTADIVVEINRDTTSILASKVQIVCGESHQLPSNVHQQVSWSVRSGLLPDELVLIFGKPLEWSGPIGPGPEQLPLVESPFCSPFSLHRGRTQIWSGPPRVDFPVQSHAVGWMYGIILVRGQDVPILGDSVVEIVRG